MSQPQVVTKDDFQEEVLDSKKPVLVDFWAEWCGPCKMIAPVVEEISEEYGDRVKVAKLDADQNQQVLMDYQIMGIPTLILFKDGEPAKRITGFRPKDQMVKELEIEDLEPVEDDE